MLHTKTITELRQGYQNGDFTPQDVLHSLDQAISARDGEVGAYLRRDLEEALRIAQEVDLSLPLGGIPIAIKDNINMKGEKCTCASSFLSEGYRAPYDATVVKKLLAAGAIPFGRTNMDEFAMGSATETSALQVTRNPHDLECIPGGSSGGSAACVGGDLAVASLGSDTGGSIRQPASHCGAVGFKPSYGRVSRYGLVAFASSLDQVGPFARSVTDAALLTQVLSGSDPLDSTSLAAEDVDFITGIEDGVAGKRIGIPKELMEAGLHPDVKIAIDAAISALEQQGAEIVEVSLPYTKYYVPTYYILATAEASSNLARFDGVRYGDRSSSSEKVLDLYENSREEGFGPEVKRRILVGTYVLSSGYYDAYYKKAQKVRTLMIEDIAKTFQSVDALLAPVSPDPARKIGINNDDPVKEFLADICTCMANIVGIPAISLPCGVSKLGSSKLPIGLQVMGAHLDDKTVFQVARAWEKVCPAL